MVLPSASRDFTQYMGPVLRALAAMGDSGRPDEVAGRVASDLKVSEEEQSETIPSGQSRFKHRVNWARYYLAQAGLIDASTRGVWSLSDAGRRRLAMTDAEAAEIARQVRRQEVTARAAPAAEETEVDFPEQSVSDYRLALLETLRGLPAEGFESFCQRLLREAGFEEVEVTGRTGDGGIDGVGLLQVNALVSVKVLFQCKRYSGTVGAPVIRDFRGAMSGRSNNGIIMTTGTFTTEAKREAVRDGVPPIELVDSDRLLGMCERLELGLRPIQTFELDQAFFDQFR